MSRPVISPMHASIFVNVILIVVVGFFVLRWLGSNTAVLNSGMTTEQVELNNLNQTNGAVYDLQETIINGRSLYLPAGFTISEYARGIPTPRFMSISEDDTLFVGTKEDDKIYAVSDTNRDGQADSINTIDTGLDTPHSTYYYRGDLYVAEQNQVSLYRQIKADGSYASKDVILSDLPSGNQLTGGGHKTRTVAVGPDEKLYISIGSSCNVCNESDERRATIMQANLDGSDAKVYATGLRNSVGFDFDEQGRLWAADMGRDQIGDDIPPEEINIIEQGQDYGWPYCYGAGYFNPEYPERNEYCRNRSTYPIFNIQAHSAPLGVSFLNSAAQSSWPQEMRDGLFIALHGSWNRTVPTGYKVVWIDRSQDQLKQYNFLTGWLDESADAWGRPVGLSFDSLGNLYLSDDKQNLIYKISYSPDNQIN